MRHIAMLIMMAIPAAAIAQTCKDKNIEPTTSTLRFIDKFDGTVIDAQTGLIWSKCPYGKSYDQANNTCTGNALTAATWREAMLSVVAANNSSLNGPADWRIPNIKELINIVERQCFSPAINISVFPDTENVKFWTSTPTTVNQTTARYVNFRDGTEVSDQEDVRAQIRLVAGQ